MFINTEICEPPIRLIKRGVMVKLAFQIASKHRDNLQIFLLSNPPTFALTLNPHEEPEDLFYFCFGCSLITLLPPTGDL